MPHWFPSPSIHLLWSAVALLLYVLSTRVDQLRRPQTSAVAWVLGLVRVPYLFLPLYLMFGRRRLRKVAHGQGPARVGPGAHWAAVLLESFGLRPQRPTAVRLHADGAAARCAPWPPAVRRSSRGRPVSRAISPRA